MMHVSEIIMLYTFNLYSAACQLCLNTARRKESIDKLKKQLKCLIYRNRKRWNVAKERVTGQTDLGKNLIFPQNKNIRIK